jgi:hypothetical protein
MICLTQAYFEHRRKTILLRILFPVPRHDKSGPVHQLASSWAIMTACKYDSRNHYKGIASIYLVFSRATMRIHSSLVFFVYISLQLGTSAAANSTRCRNVPGSPGFPSVAQWNALNNSISGHLASVIPSAKFCHSLPSGSCTDDQWESSTFRDMIPGAMNYVRLQ